MEKKSLKDFQNFYKALQGKPRISIDFILEINNAFNLESIELPPDGEFKSSEEMLRQALQRQKKRFFKAKAKALSKNDNQGSDVDAVKNV